MNEHVKIIKQSLPKSEVVINEKLPIFNHLATLSPSKNIFWIKGIEIITHEIKNFF